MHCSICLMNSSLYMHEISQIRSTPDKVGLCGITKAMLAGISQTCSPCGVEHSLKPAENRVSHPRCLPYSRRRPDNGVRIPCQGRGSPVPDRCSRRSLHRHGCRSRRRRRTVPRRSCPCCPHPHRKSPADRYSPEWPLPAGKRPPGNQLSA